MWCIQDNLTTDKVVSRIGEQLVQQIQEAARGQWLPSSVDLVKIQEQVADAWYNLARDQRVPHELVGMRWNGRALQSRDYLPTDIVYYLKRVVQRQEWQPHYSFATYRASLREVMRDPTSGLLTSQYRDKGLHLSIVRQSGKLQGPGGFAWLLVEYRVATGNIATAFQVDDGLKYLDRPGRSNKQWLRKPQ